MIIDSIFQTVQALLNKEQLGYLKPMKFNLFIKNAQRKIYNKYLIDLKSNVRKMNWMLDGKDFANFSEHVRQLIEYYSSETTLSTPFEKPNDLEFIEDVFFGDIRIEKIHYSDFLDLQRNKYASPSECNPICSLVGVNLKVSPNTIGEVNLHYLRKPLTPKWTFEEFQGKPMFNPDATDFQDVDMPESSEDELVSLVFEASSIYLRDFNATQTANQEQSQDNQLDNRE